MCIFKQDNLICFFVWIIHNDLNNLNDKWNVSFINRSKDMNWRENYKIFIVRMFEMKGWWWVQCKYSIFPFLDSEQIVNVAKTRELKTMISVICDSILITFLREKSVRENMKTSFLFCTPTRKFWLSCLLSTI